MIGHNAFNIAYDYNMPAWKCERLISGHYRLLGWLGISQLGWSRLAYHQSTSPGELSYFASQRSSMSDSSIFTNTLFHANDGGFLDYHASSELVLCISWIELEITRAGTKTTEYLVEILGTRVQPILTHYDFAFPNHSRLSPNCPRSPQNVPKLCIWVYSVAYRVFFKLDSWPQNFSSLPLHQNRSQIRHSSTPGPE